ncbi:sigma-54-dependent Fis family transcriptional regulator [Rhodoferax lacus]|uniref:Sigma-54-dependent Fis family transcriptional regulator n=1 Tax=Rhodoferax lacus TaxID=2184758 RepID=A0A3E1R806_9BURK|nr:sigma-54 dependent transcriptional regulator [Rhodoferax lacus]RFO95331.1 sigma-54-dependent Fis family transcriptional regulator [Rhodoferax lacus]
MAHSPSVSDIQILVLDDEPDLRTLYELTLLREGYQVEAAGTVQEAWDLLNARRFDLVITDMRLPDGSGIDLLKGVRAQQRRERCIVITAYGSAENAVESLKAGAFDYLTKPVDLKQFRAVVAAAARGTQAAGAGFSASTSAPLSDGGSGHGNKGEQALARMAGDSAAMRMVRERIVKVARSMAPVMVRGESGTGKELVANALHANSHRKDGPWIAVNCGAIPENLLEAEFFGAKKGAYTGAAQDREGFFQAAHGGTLFLDEIGDLPLAMQAKLLRAIQERCVRPLGGNQEESVDVRIVSATHKDLPAEVAAGRFRQDLYYRLNVIDIDIPPLRERPEDLPALCQALLGRIARDSGQPERHVTASTVARLAGLSLQGNVRELENILHRALALSDGETLELSDPTHESGSASMPLSGHVPLGAGTPSSDTVSTPRQPLPGDLQGYLDEKERQILVRALRETGFNRTLAAKLLGLTLRQIRYRIARLKIDAPDMQGDEADD